MIKKLLPLALAPLLTSGAAMAEMQEGGLSAELYLSDTCLAEEVSHASLDYSVPYAEAWAHALSKVRVHIGTRAEFEVTRHGNAGSVYQIDLAGKLTQGQIAFSLADSPAGASDNGGLAILDCLDPYCWEYLWTGIHAYADAQAGAGAGAMAASLSKSLSKVSVNAANIKEFTSGLFMVGLSGATSGSDSRALSDILLEAYQWYCSEAGCASQYDDVSEAIAGADAIARGLAHSVVAVSIEAKYQKLSGNEDLIDFSNNASIYLGCESGAWTAANVTWQ